MHCTRHLVFDAFLVGLRFCLDSRQLLHTSLVLESPCFRQCFTSGTQEECCAMGCSMTPFPRYYAYLDHKPRPGKAVRHALGACQVADSLKWHFSSHSHGQAYVVPLPVAISCCMENWNRVLYIASLLLSFEYSTWQGLASSGIQLLFLKFSPANHLLRYPSLFSSKLRSYIFAMLSAREPQLHQGVQPYQ